MPSLKRRILSFVLVLCVVGSVFSMLTFSAYAEKDYSEFVLPVEIAKGDTLYSICQARGMNYGNVKEAIIIANKFSGESDLAALMPGQMIQIPTSEAAAAAVVAKATTVVPAFIPSNYVAIYTVSSGDTMNNICKLCGLDFQANKDVIMRLNGWGNAEKLKNIYPGQEIILPTSDAVAALIDLTIKNAEKENEDLVTTTAISGDSFKYYLVKHSMPKGGSLKNVSNELEVKYTTDVEKQLLKLNDLSNSNSVKAGYNYYFLSSSASKSDKDAYAVFAHKVVAGDTIANLCASYGVTYSEVQSVLEGLNPGVSFNSIKKGSTILLVSKDIAATETPVIIG